MWSEWCGADSDTLPGGNANVASYFTRPNLVMANNDLASLRIMARISL